MFEVRRVRKRRWGSHMAVAISALAVWLFLFSLMSPCARRAPIRSRRRSPSTSLAGCRGRGKWRFWPIRSRDRMPARATGLAIGSKSVARPMAPRLSRGDQAVEQRQGQRAGRRPRLVCRFQQSADAGLLSRLRYHQPRSLVRVPDRRRRLRAGLARLRCGSSTTSGAGHRSPRRTAASGIIRAVIWDTTRIGPHSTHREAKTQGRPRDVLGGWFDAGDLNKYVPYLEATLFDLLWAYELNPRAFGDDTNIPESGNGVPDLLDEVKWELDWLLKMQDADGGFFNRVAGRSYNNGTGSPSGDTQPRFYTAKTTWATADASASLAHAARVYSRFDKAFPGYADRLGDAARRAWDVSRCSSRDGSLRRNRRRFRSLRPRRPAATRTPIAAPASTPPPNCSRRSVSRDSRPMSIAGRTDIARDRGKRHAPLQGLETGRPAQSPRADAGPVHLRHDERCQPGRDASRSRKPWHTPPRRSARPRGARMIPTSPIITRGTTAGGATRRRGDGAACSS